MTLYCCALHRTDVAALRTTAERDGYAVVDLADCGELPMELAGHDRIAVALGSAVALLGCLRGRRYPRGIDVLVIVPDDSVPLVACDPLNGITVTYVTNKEIQRLPA